MTPSGVSWNCSSADSTHSRSAAPFFPALVCGRTTAPASSSAFCASALAAPLFDEVRDRIKRTEGIYHPPVCAVTVAYPKSSFRDVELPNGFGNLRDLPGFGSLNPRTEGVRTLGTLWSSSLFPGRCPPDYNVLLNYIGGSRDVGLADLDEAAIVDEVDKGCRAVLLESGAPPPKVLGVKLWPTAIPQYELGHLDIIRRLEDAEKTTPGLYEIGRAHV